MPHQPRSITVIGAGYVGLVSAVGLAGLGHTIRLVEIGETRLSMLRAGRIPIHEAGLQEAFDAVVAAGRLAVTGAIDPNPGMLLICVGTPIDDFGRSDLTQLDSALDAIRDGFGPDDILVIRSTLPVGGTRRSVEATGLPTARVFTNPEFLRQGTAVEDFARPSRIVVGRFPDADPAALDAVVRLYDAIESPRQIVDVEAAEIIKNGANAFLALKLSFTNEIASLCEEAGADVDEVLDGIGADPRIGRTYMQPSYGFGGSCLPKELATLAVAGQTLGLPMHVTTAAAAANLAAQERFAGRIASALGGPAGRTVGLLGLAFKAGTDDTRDSPALRLAGWLLDHGATVRAYDPAAGPNAAARLPGLEVTDSAEAAVLGADITVVATEWPEFHDLPWASWAGDERLLDATSRRIGTAEPPRSLAPGRKRLFDLVVGSAAAVLLSPLLAAVGILIGLVDGRPVLFRQTRIGLDGRRFQLVKFRTMERGAEDLLDDLLDRNEIRGPAFKVTDDPRLTRTGRILRSTSLDELPQIWNVLRDDMSLVGPRPPLPREVDAYDPWHRRRLAVKPGITGLWQVQARQGEDFDQRVELDLEYIDRWSMRLDLEILVRTIPAMFKGR